MRRILATVSSRWGPLWLSKIAQGGSGALLSLSLGERGAPNDIEVQRYGELQCTATEKATHLIGAEAMFLAYPDADPRLTTKVLS